MKTVQITLLEFIEHHLVDVEDGLVIQDEGDVFTAEIPSRLTYKINGSLHSVSGEHATKEELIQKATKNAIFGEWYEAHWTETFGDIGLESPVVYDPFEDKCYKVTGIDNYVSNCKTDENYKQIIRDLFRLASNEFEVKIIDGGE